ELDCRSLERDAMLRADPLDGGGLRPDFSRGRRIAVACGVNGAGGQDPGGEHRADDDAPAAALDQGELGVERALVKERIGHGHEEEIDIALVEDLRNRAELVDAAAN